MVSESILAIVVGPIGSSAIADIQSCKLHARDIKYSA